MVLQLLASLGVSGALTGTIVWLTRSWIAERLKNVIKAEYDQKLETHKAELKAQSDTEIEKLRSHLRITAAEQEFKFARLHERRAEAVAKTYELLREVYHSVGDYVKVFEPAGDKPRSERRKLAADSHMKFQGYYRTHLIFLPKKTAIKLEAIDGELVRAFNEFAIIVDREADVPKSSIEKWIEVAERIGGDIKVALEELEDEFRRLLGDDS